MSFLDPFSCIVVIAARYMHADVSDASVDIHNFVRKHCGAKQFPDVVLSRDDDPSIELSEVKSQVGKKVVLLVHGAVGPATIRYLCDDYDLPPAQRRVQWIHCFSVGLNMMRLTEVPELIKDVPLTNGKGAQSRALAEYCMYSMLYFSRRTWQHQQNLAEHKWEPYNITELYGRKVVIFGYGDIGREAAKRALAFEMEVTGVKRSRPDADVDDLGVRVFCYNDDTEALLKEADFVINCMPGTPSTINFFNKERFALMKPTAVYINLGRGATNSEDDLVEALSTGIIAGAALDVFVQEPLPMSSGLWTLPASKLLLTDHVAGQTHNQMELLAKRFVDIAKAASAGTPLNNFSINKEFLY